MNNLFVQLPYNSGRAITSYSKAEKKYNLIRPNYFISRCGVAIYENKAGVYEEDLKWQEDVVKKNWNY